MGHIVITSTMIGRNTDLTESQDINNIVNTSQEATNTSNWQVSDETQEKNELDFGENPYSGRRVGVSRKQQERLQSDSSEQWWRGKNCPSCGRGFTARSVVKECHSYNKLTHSKSQCVSKGDDQAVFICKSCKPNSEKHHDT